MKNFFGLLIIFSLICFVTLSALATDNDRKYKISGVWELNLFGNEVGELVLHEGYITNKVRLCEERTTI